MKHEFPTFFWRSLVTASIAGMDPVGGGGVALVVTKGSKEWSWASRGQLTGKEKEYMINSHLVWGMGNEANRLCPLILAHFFPVNKKRS